MSQGIFFPDSWKFSSVVLVFKNTGERCIVANHHSVSLLSVVSKVFEKLVNNKLLDHLEKYGLLFYFQYGFRSSRSTADLLTIASDRIARVLNRSGATQAVALDISKTFEGSGMLVFFTNKNLIELQFRYLALFCLFSHPRDWQLRVVLDGTSSREYLVDAGVLQVFHIY